jgi:RNA polymerase sigma-70 factor (ECF subfamily)
MAISSSDSGSTCDPLVELMIAYQAGDLAAFELLYASLAIDVRRYFHRGAANSSVVNDLVQDTFLELHRARRTYSPPLPVRPWVFGIARKVLARSRRASQRQVIDRAAEYNELESTTPAHDDGAAIDLQQIDTALARVPPGARDVWLLHHLSGLSFRSIAARLGISEMAAKLRSSRTTKELRIALGAPRGKER